MSGGERADVIAGYVVMNDVLRTISAADMDAWQIVDTRRSVRPWINTKRDIPDPRR
jgi:2-keto-4-pentenoate hydratase/2-oxohepta-3-ene-1,7-dioic acid hydratase in catechol pathway